MRKLIGLALFLTVALFAALAYGIDFTNPVMSYRAAPVKIPVYDHGSKNADYTIDMSLADMHKIAFTAAANLTIMSSRTNDKAMVVVKSGGAWNINLIGVDNGATNLTAAVNAQDHLGFVKAFGKITLNASALNYPTN